MADKPITKSFPIPQEFTLAWIPTELVGATTRLATDDELRQRIASSTIMWQRAKHLFGLAGFELDNDRADYASVVGILRYMLVDHMGYDHDPDPGEIETFRRVIQTAVDSCT